MQVPTRVAIFREKIPWKMEQTEILIHSIGILSVSRNGKGSEYRSEPFRGRQKSSEFRSEAFRRKEKHPELRNFGLSHSAEDKNG
jgi:hypothetical protein